MTRKDYKLIAEEIRPVANRVAPACRKVGCMEATYVTRILKTLTDNLSLEFEKQYSNFDRDKFKKACLGKQ